MIGNPLLLTGGDYEISRSVRLRSSASAWFSRTPAGAGNLRTWTCSLWLKIGAVPTVLEGLLSADTVANNSIFLNTSSGITWDFNGSTALVTMQVFRDYSAFYHFVFVADTTQATATDRLKIFVNGQQITAFSTATYPTQNTTGGINAATLHGIGRSAFTTSRLFDGYLTEINFVDGQALTPSSFGATDAITGVWKPKKYIGTYGTNGFYLNFSDNSSNTATTIGKDYSGNGNNWTPNNISVTAGSAYDSMLDVPTLWADGGNGRGNYCVLNPVFKNANATYGVMATPIDGNLNTVSMGAGTNVYGSIDIFGNKGKWYAECRASSITSQVSIGFLSDDGNINRGAWINSSSGVLVDNVSKGTGGFASGNTIGIAYDSINNTVQFYVNNSVVGSAYTTSTSAFSSYFFWAYTNSGVSLEWNFGQRPFTYTPPAGFKALNTQNLPEPTIKKGGQYFNAVLWTGNATAGRQITGVGFQPDFVWEKVRSNTYPHFLANSVVGPNYYLNTNNTNAETLDSNYYQSFNADGFTIGSSGGINGNGETFVAWAWKEGATQGFDIVTWAGNSTSGRTIAHSLGVAPNMIITKSRTNASSWVVGIGNISGFSVNDYLTMNTTNAKGSSSTFYQAYGSSTFTVGVSAADEMNKTGNNYVSYLFSEVAGFSKFGSYTGNGSTDGPFVFCGFRPAFVMVKGYTGTSSETTRWLMLDNARDPYNATDSWLYANLSNAEATLPYVDFLSNGFKLRDNNLHINQSGISYIFVAFAENPFKNALAR